MGIADFQKATTLLLRQPEVYRGDALEQLLGGLSLSTVELENLRFLAEDRLAQKFAFNMSTIRRRMALNGMPLTKTFLSEELNKKLWYEAFEVQSAKVRTFHLAYCYLDFLRTDEGARSVLKENCPAFIFDLIAFEAAQAFLRCYVMPAVPALSAKTRLATQRLQIVKLSYDVPELARLIIGAKEKPDPTKLQPQLRSLFLLFVSKEPSARLSQFEIDAGTAAFLQEELRGNSGGTLPSSYQDLVAAGLCRPV